MLAPYYAVPPLMMVLIGAVFAIVQRAPLVFVLCLLMVNLMIDTPLTLLTGGILVVLVVVTTVLVVRHDRAGRRLAETA